MFKALKKLFVAFVVIATAVAAAFAAVVVVFAWKKYKATKDDSPKDESITDIFEEEDFDLDDTV